MKIEEAVQYMSKLYLERTIKSFTRDYPSKKGEDEYREIINRNTEILSDSTSVKKRIDEYINSNFSNPYEKRMLYGFIIRCILSQPDYCTTEEEVLDDVNKKETNIIELSQKSDSYKHLEPKAIDVFSVILEAALEDDNINSDELNLLIKLREKLHISEKDQILIQAKLGLFPTKNNNSHSPNEIREGLDDLQKIGIIFNCNRYNDSKESRLVIPDEIVPSIKSVIGIELIEYKYRLLLELLQKKHHQTILKTSGLHSSGVKNDLIERVIHSGIKPSEALETLTTVELSEICAEVPSLNVSGTKQEKIDRLINYFAKLVIKQFEEDNADSKYYEYLEELGNRDIDNLIGNSIVKDHDFIDRAFEYGTKYLFNEKFNLETLELSGNEHADGSVVFESGDSILLWDNKSKKDGAPYEFPEAHLEQFLRYIQNESKKGRRVNTFLVVTTTVDQKCLKNAVRLKSMSGVDTDVALISAENLKLAAENWRKYTDRESFDLNILNTTGILDWETLRDRMKWHK
jgi:hypothetical protein